MNPPAPSAPSGNFLLSVVKVLSSLRLTVVCLGCAMLLVFFGTLAQVHFGIHQVQKLYFQSLYVVWSPPGWNWGLPMPGGYLVGTVMLVNLIFAHITRFKMSWKKSGIFLTHLGVIMLLVGELLTGLFTKESQMRLDEGQTSSYSEAVRGVELAIADVTAPDADTVTVIPESLLEEAARRGEDLFPPGLPFAVRVQRFYPNARIALRSEAPAAPPSGATQGAGRDLALLEVPRAVKPDETDLTSALVELRPVRGGEEKTLGSWLLVTRLPLAEAQPLAYEGRRYTLTLRARRDYKPFALTLLDFTHERYAGTQIPKNFASHLRLAASGDAPPREVRISMNNPLRHGGYTFFQLSFANDDRTSILQVVKNPVWTLPYLSCIIIAAGLLVQFGLSLGRFARPSPAAQARPAASP